MFVRYESPEVDAALGIEVGVFGLLNRLGRRGLLSPDQETCRRATYAWFDATYPDPAATDPSVYDRGLNPRAKAWFKQEAAGHLLAEVDGLLAILDDHGVACRRSVSVELPGRLIYQDAVQVVVVPRGSRQIST